MLAYKCDVCGVYYDYDVIPYCSGETLKGRKIKKILRNIPSDINICSGCKKAIYDFIMDGCGNAKEENIKEKKYELEYC